LGFKRAIVPQVLTRMKDIPSGIELVGAKTLVQAMDVALIR
jgi:hypothetical protein